MSIYLIYAKKASRKISALTRIAPFMSIEKRKVVMNAFFTTQFSYCPLVWMCHSRTNNSKMNMLHEICLRIIYNDKQWNEQMLIRFLN